jgi:hypothetical protein
LAAPTATTSPGRPRHPTPTTAASSPFSPISAHEAAAVTTCVTRRISARPGSRSPPRANRPISASPHNEPRSYPNGWRACPRGRRPPWSPRCPRWRTLPRTCARLSAAGAASRPAGRNEFDLTRTKAGEVAPVSATACSGDLLGLGQQAVGGGQDGDARRDGTRRDEERHVDVCCEDQPTRYVGGQAAADEADEAVGRRSNRLLDRGHHCRQHQGR